MHSIIYIAKSYTHSGYVINLYGQGILVPLTLTIKELISPFKTNAKEKYSFDNLYNDINITNYLSSLGDTLKQLSDASFLNRIIKPIYNLKNNILFQ